MTEAEIAEDTRVARLVDLSRSGALVDHSRSGGNRVGYVALFVELARLVPIIYEAVDREFP